VTHNDNSRLAAASPALLQLNTFIGVAAPPQAVAGQVAEISAWVADVTNTVGEANTAYFWAKLEGTAADYDAASNSRLSASPRGLNAGVTAVPAAVARLNQAEVVQHVAAEADALLLAQRAGIEQHCDCVPAPPAAVSQLLAAREILGFDGNVEQWYHWHNLVQVVEQGRS